MTGHRIVGGSRARSRIKGRVEGRVEVTACECGWATFGGGALVYRLRAHAAHVYEIEHPTPPTLDELRARVADVRARLVALSGT